MVPLFADRADAGQQLASRLQHLKAERPIVLALPRGGVPVGVAIAAALAAPLDLVLVRKLGAPFQPELALGAVVDGAEPQTVLNQELIAAFDVSSEFIEAAKARALTEIERRRQRYLGGRPRAKLAGRTVIVVDDGIATGATMAAALRAVRAAKPARLILAVPVAAPDTLERLRPEVSEIVCLAAPPELDAIGRFYRDFRQLDDAEVVALLAGAQAAAASPSPA